MKSFVGVTSAPNRRGMNNLDRNIREFNMFRNYINNFIHITGGVPKDFKLLSYNGE